MKFCEKIFGPGDKFQDLKNPRRKDRKTKIPVLTMPDFETILTAYMESPDKQKSQNLLLLQSDIKKFQDYKTTIWNV